LDKTWGQGHEQSERQSGAQKITPMLWFDDNAEEAVNPYVSIFKNSLIVNMARYGEAGPRPKGSVMTISRSRVSDLHERTASVIAQSSGMRSNRIATKANHSFHTNSINAGH
jgi:predicted 3-demethylubiquinone-9 3-methyltransferase (glyoxalase superfamily)